MFWGLLVSPICIVLFTSRIKMPLCLFSHPARPSLCWAATDAPHCCCLSAYWLTAVCLQPESCLQTPTRRTHYFHHCRMFARLLETLIYFSVVCAKRGRAFKLVRSLIFSVPNNSFKILNEFMLRRKPSEVGTSAKQSSEPNLMIIWLTSPLLAYFSNELLSCTG